MTERDVTYLVGRLSGRDKLHESHHRMNVRVMAVYLQRLSKQSTEERKVAVLKLSHGSRDIQVIRLRTIIKAEMREFSDCGIVSAHSPFDIPDGVNMEDAQQRKALIQEVSV